MSVTYIRLEESYRKDAPTILRYLFTVSNSGMIFFQPRCRKCIPISLSLSADKSILTACDLELGHMTLNYELYLHMNHRAEYLDQTLFCSTVIVGTQTNTHS